MTLYRPIRYLILFIFLFWSQVSFAQIDISGSVSNEYNKPISNAIIKLKDSSNGLPRYFAITNVQGAYRIKIPTISQSYWLECELLGYKKVGFPVLITHENLQRDIILYSDTARLPEINVYTSPPITISGDTTTFRVDAFKKGVESNVGELLTAIPGFSVNNGRVTYNGKPVNTILIEDDDLFGSDYNTLTQNLSPKGIEKIQLIQNYNDKTYLSNRLQKGQDLAVNLKFNKKYLYKVIMSNEAGASLQPAIEFYKVRQNIVSLIPRFKSVTTTNFNNTGLLASEILGNNFNLPELLKNNKDAIQFDLTPRSIPSAVATVADIRSAIIPKNKMVENKTEVVTNNFLYKPYKKLQIKSVLQYYRDVYKQAQQQILDYTVSGSNLAIQNKQFLQKEIPALNGSSEVLLSPSATTQLVYKAAVSNNQEVDSLQDIRQSFKTYTTSADQHRRFQQQLGFSFSLDSNKIVDIRVMQVVFNSKTMPILFPSDIYDPVTGYTGFDQLHSFISSRGNEMMYQAKITTRKKKSSWSCEIIHSSNTVRLFSNASLVKTDSILYLTNSLYLNDANLRSNISSVLFNYEVRVSPKVIFRSAQRIEIGNLLFSNNNVDLQKQYSQYLPSLGLGFTFNQRSRLNLSVDIKNVLPSVSNLSEGLLFSSGNLVSKGNSNMQVGTSKNLTASYSYSDVTRRRLFGNLSIFYSQTPLLYLSDLNPTALYSVNNNFFFGRNARVGGLLFFATKYLSKIKSQLDISTNLNRVASYYSTNNLVGTIHFTNSKVSARLKTLVTSKLTTSILAQINWSSQAIDKNATLKRVGKNTIYQYSTDLVYRFTNRWILQSKVQYTRQKRIGFSNDLYLGEVLLKYTVKPDKLSFMLSGNNLFNDGQFTDINFTQNSINTQTINLLRPFWMFHINLEF